MVWSLRNFSSYFTYIISLGSEGGGTSGMQAIVCEVARLCLIVAQSG